MQRQIKLFLVIIFFATFTRIAIPPFFDHLANFSALDALALFCGAYCSRRLNAIAITLVSVWIGDIIITHSLTGQWTLFYDGCYWQYASYALITLIGAVCSPYTPFVYGKRMLAKHRSRTQKTCTGYIAMPLASAITFFVITNFGVWFSSSMYPHTVDGLVTCYIAAIPFFKYTLISDILFSAVLFGSAGLLFKQTTIKTTCRT